MLQHHIRTVAMRLLTMCFEQELQVGEWTSLPGWKTGGTWGSPESVARREEGSELDPPPLKERRGGRSSLGDGRGRKRRAIPPTKIVVERFWGLGCSQETVVAPSQASHRAALGHPVTDRQTYQMAWPGQTDRDLFIFWSFGGCGGGDCSAQAVY